MFYKNYFKNKHIFMNEKIIQFSREKTFCRVVANSNKFKVVEISPGGSLGASVRARALAQGLGPKVLCPCHLRMQKV